MNKTQFAHLIGVTPGRVTRLCQGQLSAALIDGFIDLAHPAVVDLLLKRGIDPFAPAPTLPLTAKPKAPPKPKVVKVKPPGRAVGDDKPGPVDVIVQDHASTQFLESLNHMTLDNIVRQFGSTIGFSEYLKATKVIEDILEKRIKNKQTQGDLISREFVKSHVLAHIEAQNLRILNDAPASLVRRVMSMVKAGETREAMEEITRDILSGNMKVTKDRTIEAIEQA